jgi:hypothetical protein
MKNDRQSQACAAYNLEVWSTDDAHAIKLGKGNHHTDCSSSEKGLVSYKSHVPCRVFCGAGRGGGRCDALGWMQMQTGTWFLTVVSGAQQQHCSPLLSCPCRQASDMGQNFRLVNTLRTRERHPVTVLPHDKHPHLAHLKRSSLL